MNVSGLKASIQGHQLPHFLIFSGPEWKVQQIYIQQIARFYQMEIKTVDSVATVYPKMKNRTVLSQDLIYVCRDDKQFITDEKLQEKVLQVVGKNILILLLTAPDKRTKFYKQYKDDIIEFEPLEDRQLRKYIEKEINLSERNCNILIDVCEHDYGRILLEIDKIQRYSKVIGGVIGNDSIFNQSFEKLLKDGTIYCPPHDAIFDLVDSILDRKTRLTFELLQECREVEESNMVILSVLYTNAKALLQVQQCSSKDISKSTGLTGFQINNAKKHLNKYSDDELIDMLLIIRKCEKGIKTGTIEEQFVVDYLLTSIL